jgi:ADP-L-glycero-D-manno-heptose 6-epimerase
VNLFFLDRPEKSGVFNCGTGRAESFLQLARETAKHYPDARIVEIPFPEALRGKYQGYTQADLSALRAAGYARELTPLADGVAAYVGVLKDTGGYYRTPAGS